MGTNAIYMGDRWESSLLGNSRYMWYPLSWSSGDPQIVYADLWTVDLAAGTYFTATNTTKALMCDVGTYSVLNGTVYTASSGILSGSSELLGSGYPYNTIKVSDIWVSNVCSCYGNLAHSCPPGAGGPVSLSITGISADQWLALYYANGDSTWRYAPRLRVPCDDI